MGFGQTRVEGGADETEHRNARTWADERERETDEGAWERTWELLG